VKEFINKVFSNQQVTIEELSKFIVEYAELCEIRSTTPQHVQFAIQLIQSGMFDLNYACRMCANKLGINYVELRDKNGVLLYTKIQE